MADGGDTPLMGELLPPLMNDVIVQGSPFTPAAVKLQAGVGWTIGEIVSSCQIPIEYHGDLQVFIADEEIYPGIWHLAKPKPGVEVFVRVNLRGGDGGGKDALRAVAMIAVMVVASVYAGPAGALAATALFGGGAAIGSALAIAAVSVVGSLLVNALIPPPSAKNQWGFDQELGNPYGSITGLRNSAAPYGPIPRVFGKRRMFPMLAGRPYTETVGNDQYLRMLLLVGLGPVRISDVKLGELPIGNVDGIQMELREGWESDADVTLYEKAIKEDGYSVVLDAAGITTIKTTRLNTKEISVEFAFPSGVNRIKDGGLRFHEVSFTVQYRVAGSNGSWINADWTDKNSAYGTQDAGIMFVRDSTQNGLRKSGRWSVTPGQYDVKITRTSAKPPMGETDYCLFTTLRSIVDTPFLPMKGLALIALRMKASGQLNGVPDQINCVAESYLPVWNGSTWAYQITRNPAWAYTDILRRRGLQTIMADDRIDLPTIKAWADANDAAPPSGDGPYWTFDGVMEGGSLFTALRTAASHGRASYAIKDGKYSVVRDVAQTVPVQHISPRNSWGYGGSKIFAEIPHALRIRFPNEEKQYADDEVIVYRPGYSEDGAGGTIAASTFDTLDMPGCSRAKQAWREGMYHFAVLLLRPETHVVSMDVENLRCGIGDLVRFSHDAIKIGLGFGRIKSVVTSGGNVTHLTFDGIVEMSSTKTYGVRCRKNNFASVVMVLANFNGETDTVQLVTPLPIANAPTAGDTYQFGESGLETAPMVVKNIKPGRDLCAQITLVDAQSGVWTADSGIIPPFNTYITTPVPLDRIQPSPPIFYLTSDSNTARYIADSTIIERIAVGFAALPSSEVPIDHIEVQYRNVLYPDFSPVRNDLPPDTSGIFIEPVTAGDTYEVRARCLSREGTPSAWAYKQVQAAGKTVPPFPPTTLTASVDQINKVTLAWTLSADIDLWSTEVWASQSNNRANALMIGSVADPGFTFDHVLNGPADRYYWVRSLDLSGNYSSANEATADQWFPASATGGVLGHSIAAVNVDVTDDINDLTQLTALNTDEIAAETLRGALARARQDAILYLDGVDVGTVITQTKDELQTADETFAGLISLIGAKNGTGTGFILDADTVLIPTDPNAPGGAVTSFKSLQLKTIEHEGEIQQLLQLTDGFGEIVSLVVIDGRIVGTRTTNDGDTGTIDFQADKVRFLDPDGTAGTEFRDGCWYSRNVAAATRTRYGAAFGGAQSIEWWTGPISVPEDSETKGNAYVYISQNNVGGPRFGGSDVPTGDGASSGYARADVLPTTTFIDSGSGWTTVRQFDVTGVPAAPFISTAVTPSGGNNGVSSTVEFRLVETNTMTQVGDISAPVVLPGNATPIDPVTFYAPGSGNGGVSYSIQKRTIAGGGTANVQLTAAFEAFQTA